VGEGDAVTAYQELAVVRAAAGVETLTAPWAGTVVALPVRAGDSIAPGAVVATIGDLSRLRVETTDVDEYIVWQLRRGQPVAVRIDALDRRQIPGYVRSVATQPEPGTAGSQHYPVTIDLVENPPELRLGMTTRITFSQDPAPSLP
ncbi:MAG TPA: HlyD family efflux transporter periplasmic adaptor subunit, partial [Chloroflexota bacterium]|nr:HlyD family efflux transporter periplasmic adaptor subunit [Chloroflexota bacterium]